MASPAAAAGDSSRGDRLAPWVMLAVTLVALSAGWLLRGSVVGRTRVLADNASGISLTVPAGWQAATGAAGAGPLLAARDPLDPTTAVTVDVIELGDRDVALAQQSYLFGLGQTLPFYRAIGAPRELTLGPDPATQFAYAYVADPAAENPFMTGRYPLVVAATGTLVARAGKLYIITTTTSAAEERERAGELEAIVQSVRLP